jgi:hypothetical protein
MSPISHPVSENGKSDDRYHEHSRTERPSVHSVHDLNCIGNVPTDLMV